MKIAAVCCTFLRPESLGQMIRCFERQDYPAGERELVVLDDAGQYGGRRRDGETEGKRDPAVPQSLSRSVPPSLVQAGNGWRLYSTSPRFPTLGDKRNAAARLVSGDVDALAVWDDDDLYLPWALSASVAALRTAPWSRPSLVLHRRPDGSLARHRTGGLFHGGWAYRRSLFDQAGGYPAMDNGEDQALARRLAEIGTGHADPCSLGFEPFYVYTWQGGWHLSGMGPDGYRRLGQRPAGKAALEVADPPHVDLRSPRILPEVHPRVF